MNIIFAGWKRVAVAACLSCFVLTANADAQTFTFSNTTRIDLPGLGAATPAYPSLINVSGAPANVSEIFVTLDGLTHPFLADLNFVLVGPSGGNVALMMAAGSQTSGTTVDDAILVFRDSAATMIPSNGQLLSGTYRPTNNDPNYILVDPAPQGPYGETLSLLNTGTLDGEWKLYASNAGELVGVVGNGWRIGFGVTVAPEPSSLLFFGIAAGVFVARKYRRAKPQNDSAGTQ